MPENSLSFLICTTEFTKRKCYMATEVEGDPELIKKAGESLCRFARQIKIKTSVITPSGKVKISL